MPPQYWVTNGPPLPSPNLKIAPRSLFIWYAITFLIYFDISFDFEVKRKKNVITSTRKKTKKTTENTFNERPLGIEPVPTDSESSVLTTRPSIDAYGLDTWPGPKHMRMRLAYWSATPTKTKKKTQFAESSARVKNALWLLHSHTLITGKSPVIRVTSGLYMKVYEGIWRCNESIWSYMKGYKGMWRGMKVYEGVWRCMKVYEGVCVGCMRRSMKVYEGIWKCMKVYECKWKGMEVYERVWKYKKVYEGWTGKEVYEGVWKYMKG